MVLLLVVVVRIAGRSGDQAPSIPGDPCAAPVFALSTALIKQGQPVRFRVNGPVGARLVLAVNAATLVRQPDGGYRVRAREGKEDQVDVSTPIITVDSTCTATGQFGVPLDPGDHSVSLFRLTDTSVVAVKALPLVVEAP